jgi:predicted permease
MLYFSGMAIKLLPLYVNILLGYIAGKKLAANRDTITNIMFFLINPLVIFNGILNTHLDAELLALPVLTFCVSSLICIIFYRFARRIWSNSSKNIMAFSAGSGATGYFGFPLAMIIFDAQTQGIYLLTVLGVSLYDNSLGYYISARGTCTKSECFAKLIRLPSIYAFAGAIVLNLMHVPIHDCFIDFIGNIRGVYAVLGMMIIGVSLSSLTKFRLDFKFLGMTFLAKFLVWPIVILLLVALDANYLNLYDMNVHNALILLSIVPLAVNTVVMASLMQAEPEKTAATVFLSTLFGLFYIPFMTAYFIIK